MALIERVEVSLVPLAPKTVRTDAIQTFVCQETVIIRIHDADGAVGTGYSYTIGTGGSSIIALLVDHLAPCLIGREAQQIERIWRDLQFHTHATTVGAITSLALAAIDAALWDLRARRATLPLWQLAGGAKDRAPMYTTEGGWLHLSAEELIAGALEAKRRGFAGAKVKLGKPRATEDIGRLELLRAAVGDEFEIFTDCNQAFTVAEAIRRARMLEPLDVGWIEEPLPADDLDGHIRLSRATALPVAVGESIYSLAQFCQYMQKGACSIVQVDVARIGGITPWLKVAHVAESFNMDVCPHFLMELHVSLVCAIPNGRWVEYIPQLDAITASPLAIERGVALAPMTPGLGIDWDFDAIAGKRVTAIDVTTGPG